MTRIRRIKTIVHQNGHGPAEAFGDKTTANGHIRLEIIDNIGAFATPESGSGKFFEPLVKFREHERQLLVHFLVGPTFTGITGENTGGTGPYATGTAGRQKTLAETGHSAKQAGILFALDVQRHMHHDLTAAKTLIL
jgi:hypothetical protein